MPHLQHDHFHGHHPSLLDFPGNDIHAVDRNSAFGLPPTRQMDVGVVLLPANNFRSQAGPCPVKPAVSSSIAVASAARSGVDTGRLPPIMNWAFPPGFINHVLVNAVRCFKADEGIGSSGENLLSAAVVDAGPCRCCGHRCLSDPAQALRPFPPPPILAPARPSATPPHQ